MLQRNVSSLLQGYIVRRITKQAESKNYRERINKRSELRIG